MKKLWVPFLAKLDNLFLGEMIFSDLFNFPKDKVFKIFQFNLQLLHSQCYWAAQRPRAQLPAAQATVDPFSHILAGKSPFNFPRTSRVSHSE